MKVKIYESQPHNIVIERDLGTGIVFVNGEEVELATICDISDILEEIIHDICGDEIEDAN